MEVTTTKASTAGVGFFDLLLLVNIVLKLCGVITWSWAVVLWPLWVSLGLLAVILLTFWIMCIRGKL